MDHQDKALLNIIQKNFPIASRPYQVLGEQVGIREEEAFLRIDTLRDEGIIRRLGGVFDSHRLGYQSTLCSAQVPEERISLFAEILDKIPGVTHNYLRNHTFNIWFTLIAQSEKEIERIFQNIRRASGVEEIYSLPAKHVFKIDVNFRFNDDKTPENVMDQKAKPDPEPKGAWHLGKKVDYVLSSKDKDLVRVFQYNLPQALAPYQELAKILGCSEEEILERIKNLQQVKAMRRVGAVLRHQKAGFTANAMGVWKVSPDQVKEVGELAATFREVSHCYERPTFPGWPYNLFTMVHGHSTAECEEIMTRLSHASGVRDYDMLFSLKEFKKTSMQYFLEEEE